MKKILILAVIALASCATPEMKHGHAIDTITVSTKEAGWPTIQSDTLIIGIFDYTWEEPHHYDRDPWFYGVQKLVLQDDEAHWASLGDTVIVYRERDTIQITRDGWEYIHDAPDGIDWSERLQW
jgi:hypothetical protein